MNTPTSPGAIIEAARIRLRRAGEACADKRSRVMELIVDCDQANKELDAAMAESAAAEQAMQDALAGKHQQPVLRNDPLGDAEKPVDDKPGSDDLAIEAAQKAPAGNGSANPLGLNF